ncbi:hypothetical protein LY90DRAFT_668452 [Neocallimastix californiae]|uniref:C2H2-type domain-containing protein n=1 Tax=Neocallimastix californiae TaxID=1754190 RepID=A0A1Y2DRA0_9FUNG|nr:hypothetical protein LY90DRAFT_668452 [Neocallimastix californiae]|eukprot:ORY61808.1 hypothetical protein LY90DRAFT_668452 [Neocallimastix californiae]
MSSNSSISNLINHQNDTPNINDKNPNNDKTQEVTNNYERLFHCSTCLKTFKRCEHLIRHLRIHSGEKPYKCSFFNCNKRFSRRDGLKRHEQLHLQKQRQPQRNGILKKKKIRKPNEKKNNLLINNSSVIANYPGIPYPMNPTFQNHDDDNGHLINNFNNNYTSSKSLNTEPFIYQNGEFQNVSHSNTINQNYIDTNHDSHRFSSDNVKHKIIYDNKYQDNRNLYSKSFKLPYNNDNNDKIKVNSNDNREYIGSGNNNNDNISIHSKEIANSRNNIDSIPYNYNSPYLFSNNSPYNRNKDPHVKTFTQEKYKYKYHDLNNEFKYSKDEEIESKSNYPYSYKYKIDEKVDNFKNASLFNDRSNNSSDSSSTLFNINDNKEELSDNTYHNNNEKKSWYNQNTLAPLKKLDNFIENNIYINKRNTTSLYSNSESNHDYNNYRKNSFIPKEEKIESILKISIILW